MRTRAYPGKVRDVNTSRVLSLELEQFSARPCGRITDESGRTIEFDGWISLATALEQACGADPTREPAAPDSPSPHARP